MIIVQTILEALHTSRTRRLVSKSVTVQDPQGQDGAIGSDSEGDTINDDIEHDRVEEQGNAGCDCTVKVWIRNQFEGNLNCYLLVITYVPYLILNYVRS